MSLNLEFRRILPSDKERVSEICFTLKEWRDYIPEQFDEWVSDDKGHFIGGLLDGKLIALAKITYVTDTDVLLEGLRKDKESDTKGIGVAMTRHLIDILLERKGLTSIRYATGYKNAASLSIGNKCGFHIMRTFSQKIIAFEEGMPQIPSYAPVENITDENRIIEYVRNSEYIPLSSNLLCLGWIIHPYSDKLMIDKLIKTNQCFGIIYRNEIKALAAVHPRRRLHISFLDAENLTYAKSLINSIAAMAYDEGFSGLSFFLSEYQKLREIISDLSFRSWEQENDVVVLEHPVD